jgi:hypothetical protein
MESLAIGPDADRARADYAKLSRGPAGTKR